jgi:hypothetical protein
MPGRGAPHTHMSEPRRRPDGATIAGSCGVGAAAAAVTQEAAWAPGHVTDSDSEWRPEVSVLWARPGGHGAGLSRLKQPGPETGAAGEGRGGGCAVS